MYSSSSSEREVMSDLEDSTELMYTNNHQCHHYYQQYHNSKFLIKSCDECSMDSCCSSGDSTLSCNQLSYYCGNNKCLCRLSRFSKSQCCLDHLRKQNNKSQEQYTDVKSLKSTLNSKNIENLSQENNNDSLKKSSTTDILKRAFTNLKISAVKGSNNENKPTKKSSQKILRTPVRYVYVRGLSGLPTMRVPMMRTTQSKWNSTNITNY